MGKKGSWFSAIKRVFTPSSKEKLPNESEKKSAKEKKGRGKLKHGENKSFIPLFREPSSIEKILGEADEQKLLTPRFTLPSVDSPRASSYRVASPTATSPRVASPKVSSHRLNSPKAASQRVTSPKVPTPRISSPKATSPKVNRNRKEISYAYRPEPTLRNLQLSATKIQAAYRGYMARRSFRALRGLVRLQGVVGSSNVKKQTANAMKQMQLLVRVQTQIQSRRIQMLENQALQHQAYRNDKDVESITSKWTQLCEAGNHDNWDDSLLTKEEVEARMRKKVEAVIKRERAMAYAYSHQLWKGDPKSALDMGASGLWWNWFERQPPSENAYKGQSTVKDINLTTPRTISEHKPSPTPLNNNLRHLFSEYNNHESVTPARAISEHKPSPTPLNNNFRRILSDYDNHESVTPMSTKSAFPTRGKQMHTPSRTPPVNSSSLRKYSRTRASATNYPFDLPLKDDDSLTSCPPFSAPHYMAPTVSAKAKLRASSNPKERISSKPSSDTKKRFSFPLTPNIWSSKWSKGSGKDSASRKEVDKQESMADHISVDSTVSMPAEVGRRPFNRFV
ncbi:protein IQ-DOMAIN 13-like [Nicotiana sylvestris]|uniref:Protein IQ-DOMAIN 14-like n=1 Tax=Nicotiana sylvestris TaxID=4096 RepID=A0A1U7X243_NICSY|nr:PREDICTED: protein IQ-DOMAIN 14-like [Nicotiana sylvestris]